MPVPQPSSTLLSTPAAAGEGDGNGTTTSISSKAKTAKNQLLGLLLQMEPGCAVAKKAPTPTTKPTTTTAPPQQGEKAVVRNAAKKKKKTAARRSESLGAAEQEDSYAPPESWDEILNASVKNDAIKIRRLVQEEGVPANHSNAVKQSALHLASLWGNVEAVQELLKHKANVNAQNTMSGATPLHSIMMSHKGSIPNLLTCMDLLLTNGANPTIIDYFERTPADWYPERRDRSQSKMLILKLQPQPPLFQAIEIANVSAVYQILNTRNNDPEEEEEYYKQKKTPFNVFAGKTPFAFCLDLILQEEEDESNNNNNNNNKSTSSKREDPGFLWRLVKIIEKLIQVGTSAEAEENNNNKSAFNLTDDLIGANDNTPPIHRVCDALKTVYNTNSNDQQKATKIHGLERLCRLLAPLYPDNFKNQDKKLIHMFHGGCRTNDIQLTKLFVTIVGMDINTKEGQSGMTALHFAARSGSVTVVQYLLSIFTIDVTLVNNFGKTALETATSNQRNEVVVILEEFYQANGILLSS